MGAINHDLTQIDTVIIASDRCLAADSLSIGHDGMPVCSAGMADINAIAMALSAGLKVIIVDGCGCDGLCRCMSWAGAFSVVPKGNPGLAPTRQPQSVICLCGEADDMLMMRGRGLLCCPDRFLHRLIFSRSRFIRHSDVFQALGIHGAFLHQL